MSGNMMSITECSKVFGLDKRVVEEFLRNEGHPNPEAMEAKVNTVTFFKWMMTRGHSGNTSLDLEGSKLIRLRRECEILEIAIPTSKTLLGLETGKDDAVCLNIGKLASTFSEDLSNVLGGGNDEAGDGVIAGYTLVLNSCVAYLSGYMTEPGRFQLRRIIYGKN